MLSEEEKKAIDFFKTQLKNTQTNYTSMYYHVENLELVLNLIEKQNKIIDKMAGNVFLMNGDRGCTKQEIIEYFTKLVEEAN